MKKHQVVHRYNLRLWERPGFGDGDIHKRPPVRSPKLLHPLVSGHLFKVRKDVGILRDLCTTKGHAPRLEDHASENEISEGQHVQCDITRRTRCKVRLEVRQRASQVRDLLVECLPSAYIRCLEHTHTHVRPHLAVERPSQAKNQVDGVLRGQPNLVLCKVDPLFHESGFLCIRA